MGYDFHITRSKEWFDKKGPKISLDEWKEYVKSDPEMRMEGYAEVTSPNHDTLRCENDGLAVWASYSKHEEEGDMAWFDYSEGQIIVKNADEEIRKKMYKISQALSAIVQGDEGEIYDSNGNIIPGDPKHSINIDKKESTSPKQKNRIFLTIKNFITNLFTRYEKVEPPPFKVGDRVSELGVKLGTIIAIDPKANFGHGRITVKYDNGQIYSSLFFAHGLALIDNEKG